MFSKLSVQPVFNESVGNTLTLKFNIRQFLSNNVFDRELYSKLLDGLKELGTLESFKWVLDSGISITPTELMRDFLDGIVVWDETGSINIFFEEVKEVVATITEQGEFLVEPDFTILKQEFLDEMNNVNPNKFWQLIDGINRSKLSGATFVFYMKGNKTIDGGQPFRAGNIYSVRLMNGMEDVYLPNVEYVEIYLDGKKPAAQGQKSISNSGPVDPFMSGANQMTLGGGNNMSNPVDPFAQPAQSNQPVSGSSYVDLIMHTLQNYRGGTVTLRMISGETIIVSNINIVKAGSDVVLRGTPYKQSSKVSEEVLVLLDKVIAVEYYKQDGPVSQFIN